MLELNPDALSLAAALDRERKSKGPRGPMHGVPVLIKDNIATHDRMTTTAGSLALAGSIAPRDAFLVQQLRVAGEFDAAHARHVYVHQRVVGRDSLQQLQRLDAVGGLSH